MPQPYAEGSVAGRALTKDATNLKAYIIDGANFYSEFQGVNRKASDGTPYTQLAQVGTKGVPFGLLLEFNDIDVFNDIKSAIHAALAASGPFPIVLSDDVHSINVSAVPDFPNWIQYPKQRMNAAYVAGVEMRFMSTA